MLWWNIRGGGVKKWWFFPPKRSYELGMKVKQGEQVGFLGRGYQQVYWGQMGKKNRAAKLLVLLGTRGR